MSCVTTNSLVKIGQYEVTHDQIGGDAEKYVHKVDYLGSDEFEQSSVSKFGYTFK